MTAEQVIFAVAAAVCVVSALNAVLRREPLTSALSLVVTLFAVAVIYLTLGAPFLAWAQVQIYAGGIMVLLVFVVMLLGAGRTEPPRIGRPPVTAIAVVLAVALFMLSEYLHVVAASALVAVLYLGGWWPFDGGLLGVAAFAVKMVFFIFVFIWLRATLPRVRYDRLMAFGWKVLLPLALLNLAVVSVWIATR